MKTLSSFCQGRVHKWSADTEAVLHPRSAAAIVAGVGVAVTAGLRRLRKTPNETGGAPRPDAAEPKDIR